MDEHGKIVSSDGLLAATNEETTQEKEENKQPQDLEPQLVASEKLRSTLTGVAPEPENSLENIQATLCNRELWTTFHHYGNEMILTRGGRRMFPAVEVRLSGMKKNVLYTVMLDMVQVSNHRYRFNFNTDKWQKSGAALNYPRHPVHAHPQSPSLGVVWMCEPVSFKKLKLTNQPLKRSFDDNVQMYLHSMHKYIPRLCVIETNAKNHKCKSFLFEEAEFYAVTTYQNRIITHLKIHSNPFARGFRDLDKRKQRKSSSVSENPDETTQDSSHKILSSRNHTKNQKISEHVVRSREIFQQLTNEPPKKIQRKDDAKIVDSRDFIDLASTLEMFGKAKPEIKVNDQARLCPDVSRPYELMADHQTFNSKAFANLERIVGALSRASLLKQIGTCSANVNMFQKPTSEAGTQTCEEDLNNSALKSNISSNFNNHEAHSTRRKVTPASPRDQEIFLESVNLLRKPYEFPGKRFDRKESSVSAPNLNASAADNSLEQNSTRNGCIVFTNCNKACSESEVKDSVSQESKWKAEDCRAFHFSDTTNYQVEKSIHLTINGKSMKSNDVVSVIEGSKRQTIVTGQLSNVCSVTQSCREEELVANQNDTSPTKEAANAIVTLAKCPITLNRSSLRYSPTKLNVSFTLNKSTEENVTAVLDSAKQQVPIRRGPICDNNDESIRVGTMVSDLNNTAIEARKVLTSINKKRNIDDLLYRDDKSNAKCDRDLLHKARSPSDHEGTNLNDLNASNELVPVIVDAFSLQPGQEITKFDEGNGLSTGNRVLSNGILGKNTYDSCHGSDSENTVQYCILHQVGKQEKISSSLTGESQNFTGPDAHASNVGTTQTKALHVDTSRHTPSYEDINVVSRVTEVWRRNTRDESFLQQGGNDLVSSHTVYSNSIVDPVCSASVFNGEMAAVQ